MESKGGQLLFRDVGVRSYDLKHEDAAEHVRQAAWVSSLAGTEGSS